MKVQDWGGGLTAHEVEAIEKMKQAFRPPARKLKGKGLETLKNIQSIFPWKGYSGFRFADVKERKEGEFDLVIVTHCNALIVELKHWNGTITSHKDKWYLNDKEMGRSPVSVTRNKKFLLEKKLDKFKSQFTNKGHRPQVHFVVVMTHEKADFSQLPDNEKLHVLTLTDFLQLKDEKLFNARFRPHPDSKTLNQDFDIFDKKIFGTNTVKPKSININGYYAEDTPVFSHPKDIFQEYLAQTENNKHQDQALLRRWNFAKISDPQAQTPDGRYRLVSREYDVLTHIKSQNKDLYQTCLTYKTTPQKGEITAEHIDLFELFPQQKRFNQFVGGYNGENLSLERRLGLVQILLDKFAQLHKIGIAHRDLGEHSLWLSADDEITLSGFATAYFPSEQTVGDIREVLEVSGDLAKTAFPVSADKLTPYQTDVRSLAVLAWHIIHAKRISPDSLNEMKSRLTDDTKWYSDVLRTALSDNPFNSAVEFLSGFNQDKPEQAVDFSFDFAKLEPFYRYEKLEKSYPDEQTIKDNDEKEVYRSSYYLVKQWFGTDPQNDQTKARLVFNWLENMAKLANVSPDYLPKIREFGIAKKSGCLFAVSDFIKGVAWQETNEIDFSDEQKFTLISKLIQNIEHLHSLGFTHGDLKPDNVLVTADGDDIQIHILDILDFCPTGKSQFNTAYSPEFDNPTEKQRDNFAVMKMACELLGMEWNTPSEKYAEIADVITQEYSDNQTAFISLSRFKEALTPKDKTPILNITVGGRDSFLPMGIFPENRELFVQFKESTKYPNEEIDITFIGLGGKITAFYTIAEQKFRHAVSPFERNYISRTDKEQSKCSLPIGLNITHSKYSDLSELNDFIKNNEIFKQAIIQFVQEQYSKHPEKEPIEEVEFFETQITEIDTVEPLIEQRPNIQKLWRAILDTETEVLPSVTASDELQKTENGEIYIPYDGEVNPIDQFKRDEIVEAIGKSEDGEKTFKYGVVDIGKSTLNEVHLKSKGLTNSANRIQTDTPVYLQSKQNKASYTRRKNALQRILDGESVVKDLVHYFDEHCALPSEKYGIYVSDEEFSRYDQPEKNVSLNEAQRVAFQRLIDNGPLSLLQGPPGTGKTEFISAFVHYLFDVQKVRNILLVSQSHEAVNTAAERIRKHCQRLGTDLTLVRFSNREIADSEILEDVFSPNLVGQKRRQLAVNKISNICALGRAMGLPENYLRERAELAFEIGTQIRRYQKIVMPTKDETIDEDEKRLRKKLETSIKEQAKTMGLREISEVNEILPKLIADLNQKHNIQPIESEQAGKLIDLTQDMLEALSNERTNYDEFLARSRQLVIGTCVGIGQRHIGIADNVYDWVIVDEAARSISSELAIAMQSGTRILLVGDHKQLPPLYSEEHKNALARRLGISKRGEELDQALGSDFERVFQSGYGKQTCATLKTQYRMAPAIGSLVSACFYHNELENGKTDKDVPNIYHSLPEKLKASVTWLDTASLPNAYHEQSKNGSLSNRAEADTVIGLLQDLANDKTFMNSDIVQKCLDSNTQAIGVICMYGEQKKLIRKKFNERSWDERFRRLVKIDSVDSYQGKENRVIILSLARHDKAYSTGFLHLPNRINVALSRAMDKLVIVGAKAVWENPKNKYTPLAKVLRFMQKQTDSRHYAIKTLKNGARK